MAYGDTLRCGMKKKICVVLLALMVILCSACGKKQLEVYQQAEDSGEETTQGLENGEQDLTADSEETVEKETAKKALSGELLIKDLYCFEMKILAEEFMEMYPDVIITFQESETNPYSFQGMLDFNSTLSVELMSGEAADIVLCKYNDYVKIGRNQLLCDLYPLMEADEEFRKTDYFEIRYENPIDNKRYFFQLDGEGIRYEILAFIRAIERKQHSFVSSKISEGIIEIMECFDNNEVIIIHQQSVINNQ